MSSPQQPQASPPPGESGAGQVKAFFEQWWQVVTTVALALASLLTALGVENKPAQAIGALLAPVFVGVGVFFWRRTRRRRQKATAEEEWRRHEQELRGGRASFRGSLSYRKGDTLPGVQRGVDVRGTADKIADAGFSFGVVTGGLGCGKTSLLDAGVRPALERIGFSVLFLPSPRQPRARGRTADAEPAALVKALAKTVREQLPPTEESSQGRVLIIDQMEELFADLKDPADRHEVGKLFEKLTRSGVRIVLGVRRDYFLDVYNLSDHTPSLIAHKNLFELDYFTPLEAEEVIRECASQDAQVNLDDGFPRTAAVDLTKDDGRVRPVELQIVCTALRGALRLSDYRGAGGAGGILSKYVGDTVETCPHPRAGRRLLRAACRFAERLKEDPQTADEFRGKVGLPDATPELVTRIIRHFEEARLLVRERDDAAPHDSGPRYQIPHDYLIGSIADATRQEVSRTEEADQYVEYHLREKTVIPFGRWWFIRRHADPVLLSRPDAGRLMRRSLFIHVGRVVGVAAALLLANLLLLGVGTAERVWQREIIATHHPDGQLAAGLQGFDARSVYVTLLRRDGPPRLLTSPRSRSGRDTVKLWEVIEGVNPASRHMGKITSSIIADNCDGFRLIDRRFILHVPVMTKESQFSVLDLDSLDPQPHLTPIRCFWSENERTQIVLGREMVLYRIGVKSYNIWSLTTNSQVGSVNGATFDLDDRSALLTADPPRFLYINDDRSVSLFACDKGKLIASLKWGVTVHAITADERRGLVYTLEQKMEPARPSPDETDKKITFDPATERWALCRWSLTDGTERPPRREIPRPNSWGDPAIRGGLNGDSVSGPVPVAQSIEFHLLELAGDGRYLVLRPQIGPSQDVIELLDANTLASVHPRGGERSRLLEVHPSVVAWAIPGGLGVWDLQRTPVVHIVLAGLDLEKIRYVVVSRDRTRLAALLSTGKLELWDLTDGSRIRELVPAAANASPENTDIFDSLTGNCLCESAGPARIRLYDWSDGRLLADLTDVGGQERVIHYDGVSRQVYVWSDRGDCVKYTEWRQTLARFRLWRTGHD
jgi:hypothetical protein